MRMAGKVVVHRTMSLDGFIAGPEHGMNWVFEQPTPPTADEQMGQTGAMLVGKRTQEVGERMAGEESGETYDGGPVLVLTHDDPATKTNESVTYVSGDIRDVVARGLEAAGGKSLEILGTQTADQCLELGLVDEVRVHVAPILLGDGIRLHDVAGGYRVDLELIDTSRTGGVVSLHYRVRRRAAPTSER
jgi:dihydrofolate reductase